MTETRPAPPVLPHGGSGCDFLDAYYPNAPQPWLDLSTGINPWPYPHQPVSDAAWHRLPSPSLNRECAEATASYLGVAPQNIALLPGSQSAISLLPTLFKPTSVSILDPTYGEHRPSWELAGHKVRDVDADLIAAEDTDILLLTNPNNPNGRFWTGDEIQRLAAARSRKGQWLIVDEAFADVMPSTSAAALCARNRTIVLRSFGKFFGLAGLRLGVVVAQETFARRLEALIGPWAVSGPALEVGARAYRDVAWHTDTRERLASAASRLKGLLTRHGLTYVGGTDLFLLFGHPRAAELFHALCTHGLYVRRFAAHPNWLRFGLLPDDAAHARLDAALLAWTAPA
ncbi:MAG: threonine-phosphate decarboxylase CobD [Rhizomicrobium sp.]